jgi:hypothetical protein
LLQAAWAHFFWEPPYRAWIEAHPGWTTQTGIQPDAGDRMALGFGIVLFFAGLFAVLWRPVWASRALAVVGLLPLIVSLSAGAALTTPAHWPAHFATGLWGICAVIALAGFQEGRTGWSRCFLRLGLVGVFGFWGVQALGGAGEIPPNWLRLVGRIWPGGGESEHLRMFAGLAAAACVLIWIRPLASIGAVILAGTGLVSALAPLLFHLDDGGLAILQRHLPEAVGRLGLVLLPGAIALRGAPARLTPQPRKLKRIDVPPEPESGV